MIPIWPTGRQPERQKEEGGRQGKTATSITLSLVKSDWPGYALPTDVLVNSEAKHTRKGEWRLTAAGNHEEPKTLSRNAAVSTFNAKKSRVTNTAAQGLALPRDFL